VPDGIFWASLIKQKTCSTDLHKKQKGFLCKSWWLGAYVAKQNQAEQWNLLVILLLIQIADNV
jgi:hypothetical protein